MISFTLEGHTEKLAPPGSYPDILERQPLYHQARTWQTLQDHPVVLNTYNTGTGKTIAALLHLLDLTQKGKNVLVIAPTNALIGQHVADIREFVEEHQLDFKVLPARASDISAMRGDLRAGETLQRFIANYQEFETDASRRQPLIMVTNPDIFYYALYFRYGAHDRRNVFRSFLMSFNYLIIDEFHYYDNKQIAAFLFAFLIFKDWGYFDEGRRVCLLSATPRTNVIRYLYGLLGDSLGEVSPANEPIESMGYDTIPTLTPLYMTVHSDTLPDWLSARTSTLRDWLTDNFDGAIISNSLARINLAYSMLRKQHEPIMGRITGPEPEAQRLKATARRLILATPTVDIGYNFKKLDKTRQNIDFLVSEARFQDDLIQRIGRAGRVLGKPTTDQTSYATVLLSDDAYHEFRELNGQTLDRLSFATWLGQREALSAKHQFEAYIREYAPLELAYPLYQLGFMLTGEDRHELDDLYEHACELFGVKYPKSRKSLKWRFKKQEKRETWLREAKDTKRKMPQHTDEFLADYLHHIAPQGGRPNPRDIPSDLLANGWNKYRDKMISLIGGESAVERAIFSFRDSFRGPTAVVYDPNGQFSTQDIAVYDIFHFLRNYQFDLLSASEFKSLVAIDEFPKGDFYLRLRQQYDHPLKMVFTLNAPIEREPFDKQLVRIPLALHNFAVALEGGTVPLIVVNHLREQPMVGMVLPPSDIRIVRSRFRGTDLFPQALHVNFPDGMLNTDYTFFPGTSAFMAEAELRHYFKRQDRREGGGAIII